jgi:hypothetical protein
MSAREDSPIRRWLRRFTLGSGPLKRRSDRVEVVGRLVVVLSFLAAPPLAVVAATATTTHLEAVAAAEAAERSRTQAVLLEDGPSPAISGATLGGYSNESVATVPVRAAWPGPGGSTRTGHVQVRPGTPAGTAVPVWVDPGGDLTRAPFDRQTIQASAAAMGALPLIGVPLATWTLYAVLCVVLEGQRERRWARDWAAVEPDWNSRSR